MATLDKSTIQRLAVLRVVSMWKRGAYGPTRLHKILFFADDGNADQAWRLFTYKKWSFGQFSDEISKSLNDLKAACRLSTIYDGPSERIKAEISQASKTRLARFFNKYFAEWSKSLSAAFRVWAYLSNDEILKKAHADSSYTARQYGEIIAESFPHESVEFVELSDDDAEHLSDLVDVRLQQGLRQKLIEAVQQKVKGEDWRKIYFADTQVA